MEPIYAVCLSMSQGVDGPRATAYVSCTQDDRAVSVQLAWPTMPKLNIEGDPGLWLYAALSRLVEDFDTHEVTAVTVDGLKGMREGLSAQATS